MKTITLTLLYLLISFLSIAQTINFEHIDQNLVSNLFLKHLNKLRDSLALPQLNHETGSLQKASWDQADYQSFHDTLTHFQKATIKKTPTDRINFYGGNFETNGENVCVLSIHQVNQFKNKQAFEIQTYQELSYALFIIWKYSPPHYMNMINPAFIWSGLSCVYNKNTDKIYAANVFGGKRYQPVEGLPNAQNLINLKYDEKGIYKAFIPNPFTISSANFVYEYDDTIKLNFYDIREVQKIIKDKNDGILIDIVLREQFTCKSDNNLNFSPIYDGYPLTPVYKEELYKRNSNKNLLFDANLNAIPPFFANKSYQTNTVLFKNNTVFYYGVPISILRADYAILEFNPLLDHRSIKLIDTVIQLPIEDKIYFEVNSAKPIENINFQESILNFSYLPASSKINSVQIFAYSSLEGDSIQNRKLQHARADYLKKKLKSNKVFSSVLIDIYTRENYKDFVRDFGKQLQLTKTMSEKEISSIFKQNLDKIDFSLLETHRYCQLNYHLAIRLNQKSTLEELKFLYAHRNLLSKELNKQLIQICLLYPEEFLFAFQQDIKEFSQFPKQVILPLYFYASDSLNFRKLYNLDIKTGNWTEKDRFNFVISTFRYYNTYEKPFLSALEMEKQINLISSKTISDTIKQVLKLNQELINIYDFYKNHNYSALENSLKKFKSMFLSFDLSVDDIVIVGQFFNNFNQFDWTLDLLKDKLTSYPNHEELWFTYLSTYTFRNYDHYDEKELDFLIKACIQLNKNRFCDWINYDDFQLLRNVNFKKHYCTTCENVK